MTTSTSGGGPSPLRVGGLALVGVAVVSAVIGLASLVGDGGDTRPTAAPSDATPSSVPPPHPAPAPAPLPGDPALPGDGSVPVPSIGAPPPADQSGAVPPADQPAPAPGDPASPPAPEGAPDAQAPAPAPGGSGGGANASDSGNARSAVRAPLRVYNNSTISGLATRAADDFRRAGWPIDEVGNYPHGIIPTSTVYYRPGTEEEEPARVLGEQFGMRVNPRFEGLKNASPGIIVIVASDYGR